MTSTFFNRCKITHTSAKIIIGFILVFSVLLCFYLYNNFDIRIESALTKSRSLSLHQNVNQSNYFVTDERKKSFEQIANVWPVYDRGVFHCITEQINQKRNVSQKTALLYQSNDFLKESADERKNSFDKIFKQKIWGGKQQSKDGFYGSGPGSSLEYTVKVRQLLDILIKKLKLLLRKEVIKMLDIPCGDLTWMSVFLHDRKDVNYTGMDIVPDIISHHKKVYAGQLNRHFINDDIVKNPLRESYDFILSRHMMQHLTTSDTITVLKHLSQGGSGGGWLLTTTVPVLQENYELVPTSFYRFRPQNLALPPFSLADPVCLMEELSNDLYLGVYNLPLQ